MNHRSPRPRTLAELLELRATTSPGRLAIVDRDETFTYADVHRAARHSAVLLAERGVGRGDRVAILLPRSLVALAAYFGVQMLGAVAVPVNDRLRATQVRHVLTDSGARLVVTDARLSRLVDDAEAVGCEVLKVDGHPGAGSAGDGAGAGAVPPCPATELDLAALVYTSGSTGLPKGVMTTQANVLAGAESVATYQRMRDDERVLAALPWSVDYGLNQVLSAFWVSASAVIERSSYGPDICRTLRQQRVTGVAGVPALWEMLTRRPSTFLTDDLPQLRYVTNSGVMLRLPTLERIRQAHPHVAVFLMYGFTEAFRATYLEPELVDTHPESIGRPIPLTEGLVLDDRGDECPAGAVGEYVEAGATVALGYWRNPRATAQVYRPDPRGGPDHAGERVVHSGDLVRRDEDGLLHYVGRRDEQMKIQGMKVSPTEVEVVLAQSRMVAQSVVFTARDGDDRVVLTAVVVPADPADFDRGALEAYCRRELPTYLQPDTIVVQDELPKSSWSKVDRARVKAEHSPALGDPARWKALAP